MVRYSELYALARLVRRHHFNIELKYDTAPQEGEYYVGFEVDGIYSYGCWRSDEQVAINQVVDKLRAIHEALVYWHNKSK